MRQTYRTGRREKKNILHADGRRFSQFSQGYQRQYFSSLLFLSAYSCPLALFSVLDLQGEKGVISFVTQGYGFGLWGVYHRKKEHGKGSN